MKRSRQLFLVLVSAAVLGVITGLAYGAAPARASVPGKHGPSIDVPGVGATYIGQPVPVPLQPLTGTPQVQICSSTADDCSNRKGGGTGNGTIVISYNPNDPNNDFTLNQLDYYCGNTGRVQDGENGVICPFKNGSGLNTKYNNDGIYEEIAYGQQKCLSFPIWPQDVAELDSCGNSFGDAIVGSPVNGATYLIDVGTTNALNKASWIADVGIPNNQEVVTYPANAWSCVGSGIGNC